MPLLDHYHQQCKTGAITIDQQQLLVLPHLQKIQTELIAEHRRRSSILSSWRKPRSVHGLYLWGGVGIGKTFLMDSFYQTLPFQNKIRLHFHQFMRFIHQELLKHQGAEDPLQLIAKDLASKYLVICFDEFIVTDITDAMLLGRLVRNLYSHGVCLVATSNSAPDDLYRNGLQRQHFIPTIELIKQHALVIHLPSEMDYRLRHLRHAGIFYIPNDEIAQEDMEKSFLLLVNGKSVSNEDIYICQRNIAIRKRTDDMVWFDFNVICSVPRSQQDYLAIAEKYNTVFISNVTVIPRDSKDKILLFIRLIDILYDARARLVLSAETTMDEIYGQGQMSFEYARACSRLMEMQSDDYCANVR